MPNQADRHDALDLEDTECLKSKARAVPGGGQDGQDGAGAVDDLVVGSAIGNYVVDKVLGGGGGGTVYAAHHRVLGRRVAVKVLREEMLQFPAMVTRFVREAAAVNQIRHPNIVDIFEFGELSPGRPFYVMEIIEGMDLRKLLHLHGRFSVSEMLELMEPVCGAVHAAHEAGIVHRDLKASNVLVAEKNGKRVIKLLDFGIAKMLHGEPSGQGLTEPGAMVGTAHNMAPEQIRCERVDARTDVYALGVLIFQLLTGRYPFEAADPMAISMLHLQAPPPRPSALAPVPPAIDAVVLRCLEKLPSRRFRSVSDLVTSLSEAIGQVRKAPLDASSDAVGAYFEVLVGDEEEMDDAMMEDMIMVLDAAERTLASSGFVFPLKTSTSLLGVRLLAPEADADGERADVEAAVDALLVELEERPTRHPDVRVEAAVSVGEAVCRSTESGVEVVGGPLLEVGTWTDHGRQG